MNSKTKQKVQKLLFPRVSLTFPVSAHRTRVKGKLGGEVHACRQAEWVHVQHRVVRVQQLLGHRVESGYVFAGLRGSRRLALLLGIHHRWECEWRRVWSWAGRFGLVLVGDNVGLSIILLFCGYGVSTTIQQGSLQRTGGTAGLTNLVVQCGSGKRGSTPREYLRKLRPRQQPVSPSRPGQVQRFAVLLIHRVRGSSAASAAGEHAAAAAAGSGLLEPEVSRRLLAQTRAMSTLAKSGETMALAATVVMGCQEAPQVPAWERCSSSSVVPGGDGS